MKSKAKKNIRAGVGAARMVEDVIGCKWSLTVLGLVASGVRRPGAMQRRVAGLTAKVLNERLRKLLRFGIIERQVYAEVPPRVEYTLTNFGRQFDGVLKEVAALEEAMPGHARLDSHA